MLHAADGLVEENEYDRVVESSGVERLELAAIIFEYSNEYEIMRAHPLKDLAPDSTFSA